MMTNHVSRVLDLITEIRYQNDQYGCGYFDSSEFWRLWEALEIELQAVEDDIELGARP